VRWFRALVGIGVIVLLVFVALEGRSGGGGGGRRPVPAGPAGFVSGRVMGRYGTILGVPVRVLVNGVETAQCRTDCDGRYRLEAPSGIRFALEAMPESWTKLEPIQRMRTVDPGAEITEDFVFGVRAGASGHIEGPAVSEPLTLLAIPVDDYPSAPGGWAPPPDLREASKAVAEAMGTFTFDDLDAAVTYRLAVDGYEWGLTHPVFLSAGDTGVNVPIERLLFFVALVTDIESGEPIRRFTVRVVDRQGIEREEVEGRDGRVAYHATHPEQVPPEPPDLDPEEVLRRIRKGLEYPKEPRDTLAGPPPPPWKLMVDAEGYLESFTKPSGVRRVAIQRARQPNVFFVVKDEDGRPWDRDIEATFEAAEEPLGVADAHVVREGPGMFSAVMPPGTWRLKLHGMFVVVEVPASGAVTVDVPPLPPMAE